MSFLLRSYTYLLLLFLIISCNNKAVEYNNDLAKIQKSVLPEVQAFSKKMEQASTGIVNVKDLENDAKNIVSFLDKKIAAIDSLNVADDGQALKTAIIDQLKFKRDVFYKTGRLGGEKIPEEEKNIIIKEFMNSEADAQKLEERIFHAQKLFAEKNNFTLEKK